MLTKIHFYNRYYLLSTLSNKSNVIHLLPYTILTKRGAIILTPRIINYNIC